MFILPYSNNLYIDEVSQSIYFKPKEVNEFMSILCFHDWGILNFAINKFLTNGHYSYYRRVKPLFISTLLKFYNDDIFANT